MNHTRLPRAGRLVAALALLGLIFAPLGVAAQGGATNVKLQATLVAPDGATNANAKGKAKLLYRDNGNSVLQKLSVTMQQLERRTDYRIMIDGLALGVFSPRGNSGSVTVRFRTPAKGNQDAIPESLGDPREFTLVEVFDDTTGELVLTGTFTETQSRER